jgi:hypothetical protein
MGLSASIHRRAFHDMKRILSITAIVVAIAFAALYRSASTGDGRNAQAYTAASDDIGKAQAGMPAGAARIETTHYAIVSTASHEHAVRVGTATESLYRAYADFFAETIAPPSTLPRAKLKLRLYRDRAEFQANNRSRPWAEAYYLKPVCHAYVAHDKSNPYHWMIHEATHQLNTEVAGFKRRPWIEEGLATYFGSSRILDGELFPGAIDPTAYPIWWLSTFPTSGDRMADTAARRWIPLRALLTGEGAPPIDRNVNLYYIQYWSLTHFLFHYEDGRHAAGYKRLIADGGDFDEFERLIGPADRIEREWYDYLQKIVKDMRRLEDGTASRT